MRDSSDSSSKIAPGGKIVGELLKKAVSLGAGAYVAAEDTVAKTLNTVALPKEYLKEAVESLFDSYTIVVNAEIQLKPKKKQKEEGRPEGNLEEKTLEGDEK